MRIVCLITVGAFLLSITIAESDVPIGTLGQYHHHHHHHHPHQHYHRLPHPIILEPVVKLKSESSPFDWLIDMVSRVMEPPKKPPPTIIGPISLPRMGRQIYIRQTEHNLPWDSSRVLIKMVTHDPVTGPNVPLDSEQLAYHRSEDSSSMRKLPNSHVYQSNNPSLRQANMIQQGYPAFGTNQYSNWQSHYRPTNHQHYSSPYPSKQLLRTATPNDFRHEGYPKNHQDHHHDSSANYYRKENYQRFQPMPTNSYRDSGLTSPASSLPSSMQRSVPNRASNEPIYTNSEYNDRESYKDNNLRSQSDDFYTTKPDFPRSTQIPYPEYATRNDNTGKTANTTASSDNNSAPNNLRSLPSALRHGEFVRTDRMVPSYHRNQGQFSSRERVKNSHRDSSRADFRGFRAGPTTRFELEDVGGLEIIAAPNFKHGWDQEIDDRDVNESVKSRDSGLTEGEDSMSMGNGKNLARGESTEHSNDEQTESQTPRILQSRLSSYKVIDRSHRSQGSQNLTLGTLIESLDRFDRMDVKKNHSISVKPKEENNEEPGANNETAEVVQKVNNLTASNRWRFQEGRQPTRIVKAIYRRKPISEIVRDSVESTESGSSNEETNSYETSLEN